MDANHRIISELINALEKEISEIFRINIETSRLQAQIYDLQNQNCEYELRFKQMSYAANFRISKTTSSFVDGKPMPWKLDDEKEDGAPAPPKDQA